MKKPRQFTRGRDNEQAVDMRRSYGRSPKNIKWQMDDRLPRVHGGQGARLSIPYELNYSSSSFTSPRSDFAFSMIFSCNCMGTTS